MAINPLALGKGLDLLIRETRGGRDAENVQSLPLKDLIPNPNQPRRKFPEKALEELAASIRSQGLLQPILVRPLGAAKSGKYEIVAGERRFRASKLAGLQEVPVLIRNFSDQETLTAALVENLQREDLNPLEEALAIQALKEQFHLSQEDLAEHLGKSRSAIANSLRLLALPENIHQDIVDGRISAGHARALLVVTEPQSQEYFRSLILEEHLSVREAEGLAAIWKSTGSFRISSTLQAMAASVDADAQAEDTALSEPQPEIVASPPPAGRTPAKAAPQSARLLEVQSMLGDAVKIPVRVTGKEDKGKISFSYSSKSELETLLVRLGISTQPALSCTEHTALEGTTALSITGAEHPALAGVDRTALEGEVHSALTSTEHTALEGEAHTALEGQSRLALGNEIHTALTGEDRAVLEGEIRAVLEGQQHAALEHTQQAMLGVAESVEATDLTSPQEPSLSLQVEELLQVEEHSTEEQPSALAQPKSI